VAMTIYSIGPPQFDGQFLTTSLLITKARNIDDMMLLASSSCHAIVV
jgi:hypothetical protein